VLASLCSKASKRRSAGEARMIDQALVIPVNSKKKFLDARDVTSL